MEANHESDTIARHRILVRGLRVPCRVRERRIIE
jgi:hypothetical protein